MKLLGYSLIRTDELESIKDRLKAVEDSNAGFNVAAAKQTECQISVFTRMENRLQLLEAMHGVRFEPYNTSDLNKSGQGRYGKIDKQSLRNLVKRFTRAYNEIENEKKYAKRMFKKWGIKK